MEQKTKEIATVYNKIIRTREHPNEINQSIMTAIQKPGKPKWLIKNIRPIYFFNCYLAATRPTWSHY